MMQPSLTYQPCHLFGCAHGPPPDGTMRVGCGPLGFGREVAWEERTDEDDTDDASNEEHEEHEGHDEEGVGWRAVEGQ